MLIETRRKQEYIQCSNLKILNAKVAKRDILVDFIMVKGYILQ